jgi:hypothetical protein
LYDIGTDDLAGRISRRDLFEKGSEPDAELEGL